MLATAGFLEFDIVPGLSSGSVLAVSILRAGMVSTVVEGADDYEEDGMSGRIDDELNCEVRQWGMKSNME